MLKNQLTPVKAQPIAAKSVGLSKSTSANSSAVSLLFIHLETPHTPHTIWAILSCLLWLLPLQAIMQNTRQGKKVEAPALAFPWMHMKGHRGVPFLL